jgi:hypothetical protein
MTQFSCWEMTIQVPPQPKPMILVFVPKVQSQTQVFSIAQRMPYAVDSTTLAPRSSDGWHDIDDFPETAPRLQLAEQGASTSNSIHPHTPSSRLSSEPLHDSIISTDFQAATPSSSPLLHHCRALPETQLSQEGHLHTGRGVADEHELVDHALDTLLIDEGARKLQRRRLGKGQNRKRERRTTIPLLLTQE